MSTSVDVPSIMISSVGLVNKLTVSNHYSGNSFMIPVDVVPRVSAGRLVIGI